MKFVFGNSKHNIFHWLAVVIIRIVAFLIITPFNIYLVAIGFILSEKTVQSFTPLLLFEKIIFYLNKLPYFLSLQHFTCNRISFWCKNGSAWWTMVVGAPFVLMGISIFFINFFNLFYSIFSLTHNQINCPFCKEPIKIKPS